MNHVEQAAQAAAADVVAWVRGHPQYAQIIEALGTQAIAALAKAAGL